jgi:hypothetical protein
MLLGVGIPQRLWELLRISDLQLSLELLLLLKISVAAQHEIQLNLDRGSTLRRNVLDSEQLDTW